VDRNPTDHAIEQGGIGVVDKFHHRRCSFHAVRTVCCDRCLDGNFGSIEAMRSLELFAGGGGLGMGYEPNGSPMKQPHDQEKCSMMKSPYTVIGYWTDTMQRFATSLSAASADDAERACLHLHPGVAVCGVLAGYHRSAETAVHVGLSLG
jgi:hypothetical protein